MKLQNVTALILRIIGALLCLNAVGDAIYVITDLFRISRDPANARDEGAIIEAIGGLVVGYCLIYYSKKLTALFCRGLDDV